MSKGTLLDRKWWPVIGIALVLSVLDVLAVMLYLHSTSTTPASWGGNEPIGGWGTFFAILMVEPTWILPFLIYDTKRSVKNKGERRVSIHSSHL